MQIGQERWFTITKTCHHCKTEELEDQMHYVQDGVRDGTVLCPDCYGFYLEIFEESE